MNSNDNTILKQMMEQAWPIPPQPAGSRERFAQRLAQTRHAKRRHRFFVWASAIGIAASLVMALLIIRPQSSAETKENVISQNISTSIAELKGYYKAQMWSETEYILELSKDMKPEMQAKLMAEVTQLTENPDSVALTILSEDIDDDRKIYYITSVYMAHLRSLQYIHQMLAENKMASDKQ